jgi:uncharacterized caspase-like protein
MRSHEIKILMIATLISMMGAITHAEERQSGRRVALVLGNSAYTYTAPLANPRNDAEDIAAMLIALDFEVISKGDLDKRGMDQTIKRFREALEGAEIGFFFYAGHSLQVEGYNYLVPIDAKLKAADALERETGTPRLYSAPHGRGRIN